MNHPYHPTDHGAHGCGPVVSRGLSLSMLNKSRKTTFFYKRVAVKSSYDSWDDPPGMVHQRCWILVTSEMVTSSQSV